MILIHPNLNPIIIDPKSLKYVFIYQIFKCVSLLFCCICIQKLKYTYFLSAFFKLIQWISQSIYENQWASVEFIIIICLGSMMYFYAHEHVSITLEVVCPIQLSTVHHDEQRMLQIFRVCASFFPSRSWLSSSSFWLFITLNIQYCISLMLMLLMLLQRHSMKSLYWSQSYHCCDVSLLFLSSIFHLYMLCVVYM